MTELPEPEQFGEYSDWPGRAVLDANGERLGEVREIYLDDATDRPEWVLIERSGSEPRFVPLADARVEDQSIRVAMAAERIEAAPALEPTKQLTLDQERDLYSHYGVQLSEQASDSILPATGDEPGAGDAPDTAAEPAAGADTGAADAPAAGGEPLGVDETASTGTPAVTGGGSPGTWSSAGAQPEGETSVLGGEQIAATAGGPEAGDPDATAGESADSGGAEIAPAPVDAPKLPPPGETSEPEDRGPMVPPRPEPVAPSPPPPPPPPDAGGPLTVVKKNPAPVIGGGIAILAVILFILRRRS
jgi:sporulation protein YlmC with PRC-barrel domain